MSAAWDRARDVIADVVDSECDCGNWVDGQRLATAVMEALVHQIGLHSTPHTRLDGRRTTSLGTRHIPDQPTTAAATVTQETR